MTKKKQTTNILCKIGVHDWDDWQHIEHSNPPFSRLYYSIQSAVDPKIKCLQVRYCRRAGCGARDERYEHDLLEEDWQYTEEEQCLQRRECRRCGKIIERTQHIWGYGYPNDNTCDQVWLCKRCGHQNLISKVGSGVTDALLGPEKHDWGEWQYIEEESCTQVRVCRRNEQHRETRENHDWEEWEYINDDLCKQVRVCKRNSDHKDEQLGHVWGEWEYVSGDPNNCVHSRECLRCGYSEKVTKPHKWSEWQHLNASPYHQISQCEFCGQEQKQFHCEESVIQTASDAEPATDTNTTKLQDNSTYFSGDEAEAQDTSSLKAGETELYRDFNLHIAPDGHIVASSCEGQATTDIPTQVSNAIVLVLKLIEKRQTDADLLKQFGQELYNWLFPGLIHTHFQQTEAVARREKAKMRLRLRIEAGDIASLPLEFLYRDIGGYFLAVNPNTVLSRYLNLPSPPRRECRRKEALHMLTIIADPTDQPRLNPDEWEALIQEALADPLASGQMTLQTVKRATRKRIRNALLKQKPDIIQFVGHGVYQDGKGYLALVDDKTGKTWFVDDKRFSNLYLGHDDYLGLISLATCESAKSDDPQGFLGIAPQLVQRGVPAVVTMQYKIYIKTAKVFLEDFYTSVAARKPIDWAVQSARNAISLEFDLDNREFATPVLYMRAQDGNIF